MTKRHHAKKPRSKPSAPAPAPQDGIVYSDLLAQLARTLWLPHDLDETEKAARLAAASVLLEDINPAAGVESLLAVQMVATHEAAMECLRRSMAPDQSPEERDQNLKHSERLLGLYARQMDVLGRHRTREQKLRQQRNEEQRAQEQQDKEQRAEQQQAEEPEITRIRRVYCPVDELRAVHEGKADMADVMAKASLAQAKKESEATGVPVEDILGPDDRMYFDPVHKEMRHYPDPVDS